MSNSSLVSIKVPASTANYTKGRSGRKIEMISIHHMAGVMTAKNCGKVFQNANRGASSHYGIGNDGEIGLYVDEANTAWTNSNWDANCKAVTIETSNSSTGGQWLVGDKALNSLIKLVADIAKRNNLGTLVKGKNVTWHRMYIATTCPGDYLLSKMDYIVEEANKLNAEEKVTVDYMVRVTTDVLNIRAGAGTNYKVVGQIKDKGVYTIVEVANGQGATLWGKLKSGAGWISLDYTEKYVATAKKPEPKKSNNEIAKEVLAGKWGVGSERKKKLTEAGYNYNAIQKIVNKYC